MPEFEGTAIIKFRLSGWNANAAERSFQAALGRINQGGVQFQVLTPPTFMSSTEREAINEQAGEVFGDDGLICAVAFGASNPLLRSRKTGTPEETDLQPERSEISGGSSDLPVGDENTEGD